MSEDFEINVDNVHVRVRCNGCGAWLPPGAKLLPASGVLVPGSYEYMDDCVVLWIDRHECDSKALRSSARKGGEA